MLSLITNYFFSCNHFTTTFQTLLREPLPPNLAKENEITNDKPYLTTNEYFHDKKTPGLLYSNMQQPKAPGHWKVTYMKDLTEKVSFIKDFDTTCLYSLYKCHFKSIRKK